MTNEIQSLREQCEEAQTSISNKLKENTDLQKTLSTFEAQDRLNK